jgi:5-hydroxyisourate hydrolase-like protein (transthyretin family)
MAYIPKSQPQPLDKYTREYTNEAGTISTWYYDKSISSRGPYKVEHKYTKEYLDSLKEKKKRKLKTK